MLAVAGAGKTTYLVSKLNEGERFLIVTYTTNNVANLKRKIIQRFGYFPSNITLLSYYVFLYHICFLPFAMIDLNPQGIYWKQPDESTLRIPRDKASYYITREGRLYHNRISQFCHKFHLLDIKHRIEKYFDHLYFDEVQDLAGHDFDFIHALLPLNIETMLVGDFFQHTFDTSVDGNLHTSLYDDFKKYHKTWDNVTIDVTTLSKSYRCTKQVCDFVQNAIGIAIESLSPEESQVIVIDDAESANAILLNDQIVKLVFKENYKYAFNAINWGASKGMDDFEDICVVLYKTAHKHFQNHTLAQLPPSSRNKLYVACTRAHRHLYIMSDELAETYKRD